MKAPIALKSYDPQWPVLFEIERQALRRSGGRFRAMHHVGSTSIPGMAAKPIIDILVVLDRHEDGFACVDAIRGLGYKYRGESGIAGRHYFRKGHAPTMCICSRLAIPKPGVISDFATTFVAYSEEARAYEALKRMLAARFGSDTYSYSNAKDEFCARIERLAQLETNGK